MQDITEVPPGSKPYLSYQETPPKGIGLDNLVDDISHACLSQARQCDISFGALSRGAGPSFPSWHLGISEISVLAPNAELKGLRSHRGPMASIMRAACRYLSPADKNLLADADLPLSIAEKDNMARHGYQIRRWRRSVS
ncbi:hypothetical protein PCH_Pc13g01070 [Penicillium rubens Wisconsin 54-1255]|uniref:Uncharacterized protein n=1 Tax=Penicillium rubens (strain ATCC 28089 / DSM 1075 / NRRL 1951 / Wisconsin 54-1255) TaxID=500485 RepID=B6H1N4_PENRW|nr:hypothetical protein PCH_Pc13g01070 [Penicillium rubens Wisconsin 54-1255]